MQHSRVELGVKGTGVNVEQGGMMVCIICSRGGGGVNVGMMGKCMCLILNQ